MKDGRVTEATDILSAYRVIAGLPFEGSPLCSLVALTVPGPSITPQTDYLRVTQPRNHEDSLWLHELLLLLQRSHLIGNSRATVGRFSKQQTEAVSSRNNPSNVQLFAFR